MFTSEKFFYRPILYLISLSFIIILKIRMQGNNENLLQLLYLYTLPPKTVTILFTTLTLQSTDTH